MAKIRNTPDDTPQNLEVPAESEKIPTTIIQPDKEVIQEPDSFITEILKVYQMYEILYIDKHGGAYTPDTAPEIRKNAVCYTNPFYKP